MNKAASQILAFAAVAVALSACTTTSVNVPLAYAKLDAGYINAGFYQLGHVFVWDRKNQVLLDEKSIVVPPANWEVSETVGKQLASLSTDTNIELSGAAATQTVADASVKAAVAHSTTTELDNAHAVTIYPLDWVNLDNDITRQWRQRLANNYAGGDYEFYVLDRVVAGEKIKVGMDASHSAGAGANIISVGANVKLAVTFDSKDSYEKDAPPGATDTLLIRGTLLRLDTSTPGQPEFVRASQADARAFSFQKAIPHLQ